MNELRLQATMSGRLLIALGTVAVLHGAPVSAQNELP
jgi:hypothetical protein